MKCRTNHGLIHFLQSQNRTEEKNSVTKQHIIKSLDVNFFANKHNSGAALNHQKHQCESAEKQLAPH
jgi:hypothetical protein